ncbi:MAG TPA: hypothetical protein VL221_10940 [Bacteroidota bacterium]|nr:hypothetical protein [Bacteroidota bacterium]
MENAQAQQDHSRISPTAKITAYWRSLTDIPFSEEIARAVDAEQTARQILGDRIVQMGTLSPSIFEVRYKSINRGLAHRGMKNVLEVACGLSPHGLEIAAAGGTYVGTDLPEMLAETVPIMSSIAEREKIPATRLHFKPANVLANDDLEAAASLFRGERFAVCNEGLLMYLNREERTRMAENVRALLLTNGGCWITTDIVFRVVREAIMAKFGAEARKVVQPAMKNIAAQTGRDVTSNDFESREDARAFYENLGFEIEEFPMYSGDYTLSTAPRLGDSFRDTFLGILSSARTWILTPRK